MSAPSPDVQPTESYRLTVNGRDREVVDAWIGESLLYVLRERLALPGSKNACEQGAVQCGFCIPGMIVAIHDLLDCRPDADELTLREAISGNLCRCTGYGRIFAAFHAVKQERARAST